MYWLKEVAVEEEHEAVMIDLAGDSYRSSNTDTASETEGM